MGLISTFGGNLGGAATAVNTLVNMFTSPMIGTTYKLKADLGSNKITQGFMSIVRAFGLPVFTDQYAVKGGNEISEQILVTAVGTDGIAGGEAVGALSKICDNIVVSPRTWTLHGYMGAADLLNLLSAIPGGAWAVIVSLLKTLGSELLNILIQTYVQDVAESRQPFKFITSEGEAVPSLFKEYSFSKTAENQNYIECDFVIQEFRYVALTDTMEQITSSGGLFSSGANIAMIMSRCAAKAIF